MTTIKRFEADVPARVHPEEFCTVPGKRCRHMIDQPSISCGGAAGFAAQERSGMMRVVGTERWATCSTAVRPSAAPEARWGQRDFRRGQPAPLPPLPPTAGGVPRRRSPFPRGGSLLEYCITEENAGWSQRRFRGDASPAADAHGGGCANGGGAGHSRRLLLRRHGSAR